MTMTENFIRNKTGRWAFLITLMAVFLLAACGVNDTATPNNAMKPIPADMLKGIPLMSKANTPPIAANGIAVNINRLSLIELNVKYSKTIINNSDIGTAIDKRCFAACKFSN